jgi:carbamoyl-phosphate synthase small subunit
MEAILALEDGTVFRGKSLGAAGEITGEVVFNTGLTGYQEILTDPSYAGQIVTMTVPHVGNTGVNDEDPESGRPQARGFCVRESGSVSSWRASGDLHHYLKNHGVVGIEGLDTRCLTRHLRSRGVVRGCLTTLGHSADEAVRLAQAAPRLEDQDLVGQVTCARPYVWREGRSGLLGPSRTRRAEAYHVVVFDFGVKRNILRLLADTGLKLTVVPARTSAADALALRPDGVFLSNGPGDPAVCAVEIETIRALIGRVPIFGICLGIQLLAHALGGATYKLKFGHRGTNHPVRDEESGRVEISSQNHGYAVDEARLPPELVITHRSLYDGTIEGFAHRELPLFAVQYHPEAAPGPHDSWHLFDRFIDLIAEGRPLPRLARVRTA